MKIYVSSYRSVVLLFSFSFTVNAQQLSCNPSCSDTASGYINEISRGGILTVNDVTLTSGAPRDTGTYPNVTIGFGRKDTALGNLELNTTNLTINTIAPYSDHSRAIALGSSTYNSVITANINDSHINYKSANGSSGNNTIGILMESDTSGQIYDVNLSNTDMHISSTSSNNTVGGIWTYSAYGFAETNIMLDNTNLTVESSLGTAYGIRTENKNSPQNSIITIQDINPGTINVNGYNAAYGVSIDTMGKSTLINNKSNINVEATSSSSQAYGIYSRTQENTINIQAQTIKVKGGSQAYGVNILGTGNQSISNSAAMTVESSSQATGILAQGTSTSGQVAISTTGDITVRGVGATYGISAISKGSSTINVASNIDASNTIGVVINSNTTSGSNNITLHTGANVIGGASINSAGITMQSTTGTQQLFLAEGSQLSSKNDLALSSQNSTGSSTVDNNGQIIGYATLVGNNVVFNNQATGVVNLKSFNNSIKNDITYTIGTVNGLFNNAGTIKFADENFDGTATNATFNVGTFSNSGIIDLTGKNPTGNNDLVGDTFTINGNYVSDAGSIYLNTVLDDASSNGGQGTSDLIIVNGNVTTGIGATKLYITPTASTASLGQLTTGNGIKVIDIQGTSSNNAFQLGRPVVAGVYEYTLGQGHFDDSWYLSSYSKNNGINSIIQYNPAMGAYLANQTAAVQMFQQTLFDRLISSSDVENNEASKNLFWMRTKMTHGSYDSVHGGLSNRTRSYTLQMGGDLNVWSLSNGGYFHLGLMGGYGDFKDTSKSYSTGTKADGKVKGYTAGIYGTYFANADTTLGFYVDSWSQMGWYRNEVSGDAQIGTKKYNSTLWSNSLELGYGIPLSVSGEYQWLVTPQAQFTYNYYDVDNQHDKNNLSLTHNNASGLDTRLGIRFHAQGVKENLIEPFLEVNWLDTTAKNTLDFNGKSYKDGFAKDRFEAKVGLQGNINKRWSVSAQMGGQWGNNSYHNYQGQLNINYKF